MRRLSVTETSCKYTSQFVIFLITLRRTFFFFIHEGFLSISLRMHTSFLFAGLLAFVTPSVRKRVATPWCFWHLRCIWDLTLGK